MSDKPTPQEDPKEYAMNFSITSDLGKVIENANKVLPEGYRYQIVARTISGERGLAWHSTQEMRSRTKWWVFLPVDTDTSHLAPGKDGVLLAQLVSTKEGQNMCDKWQDIESAPKDGTVIRAWASGWAFPADTWYDTNAMRWLAEPAFPVGVYPTHWHPVLPPPKPKKKVKLDRWFLVREDNETNDGFYITSSDFTPITVPGEVHRWHQTIEFEVEDE